LVGQKTEGTFDYMLEKDFKRKEVTEGGSSETKKDPRGNRGGGNCDCREFEPE
jgi:hypothetical protein